MHMLCTHAVNFHGQESILDRHEFVVVQKLVMHMVGKIANYHWVLFPLRMAGAPTR
jgi:hypothetical protein